MPVKLFSLTTFRPSSHCSTPRYTAKRRLELFLDSDVTVMKPYFYVGSSPKLLIVGTIVLGRTSFLFLYTEPLQTLRQLVEGA